MRRTLGAPALLRAAHACLAAGLLLAAGLEAAHAAARFEAYAAWSGGALGTGAALRATAAGGWLPFLQAAPFLLVAGLLLLGVPAASGLYPVSVRRRATAALAALVAGLTLTLTVETIAAPGSVLETWIRMNVVNALAATAAVTLLTWAVPRARLFALAGGLLLSVRGIAREHADVLVARALRDETLWNAALAWSGAPMILGAAGLLAFTAALAIAARGPASAPAPTPATSPTSIDP